MGAPDALYLGEVGGERHALLQVSRQRPRRLRRARAFPAAWCAGRGSRLFHHESRDDVGYWGWDCETSFEVVSMRFGRAHLSERVHRLLQSLFVLCVHRSRGALQRFSCIDAVLDEWVQLSDKICMIGLKDVLYLESLHEIPLLSEKAAGLIVSHLTEIQK